MLQPHTVYTTTPYQLHDIGIHQLQPGVLRGIRCTTGIDLLAVLPVGQRLRDRVYRALLQDQVIPPVQHRLQIRSRPYNL